MQVGEDDFDGWDFFFWVQVDWDVVVIVFYIDVVVGVDGDDDVFVVVVQCFVRGVVDYFLEDVQWIFGVCVYVWMLFDWFQFFEDMD